MLYEFRNLHFLKYIVLLVLYIKAKLLHFKNAPLVIFFLTMIVFFPFFQNHYVMLRKQFRTIFY